MTFDNYHYKTIHVDKVLMNLINILFIILMTEINQLKTFKKFII